MSAPFEQQQTERKVRRTQDKLSDLNVNQVKALKDPGTYRVSKGLNLVIGANGSRRWWHLWSHRGKAHEMALGDATAVTLAEARAKVNTARAQLDKGLCPLGERHKPAPAEHPFREVARLWYAKESPGWTNDAYKADVWSKLTRCAFDVIGDMDVATIRTEHAMKVIEPIWQKVPDSARKTRSLCEQVMAYARAYRWFPKEEINPFVWDENLKILLSKPTDEDEQMASLHFSEAPELMATLRGIDGADMRCLETIALTGLRSGEVYGARREEFDFDKGVWNVPACRMKKRRDHTVPLSPRVIEIVRAMPANGSEYVFGLLDASKVLRALARVHRVAGKKYYDHVSKEPITVRGMRATFATWAGENSYDDTLIAIALAHQVGDDTFRRYMRADKLAARLEMMTAWAAYTAGAT